MRTREVVLAALVAGVMGWARTAGAEDAAPTEGDPGAEDRATTEAAPVQPTIDPEKAADIRRLLELVDAEAEVRQTMIQVTAMLRNVLPKVPPEIWEEYMREVKTDEVIEILVGVYDRNLSHDDVRAMIAFYSSPAGRRVVRAMPGIARDSVTVGQEWGKRMGERMMRRLRERNLTKDPI